MHHMIKESSLTYKEALSDEKKNDTFMQHYSFKHQLSKESCLTIKKHFLTKRRMTHLHVPVFFKKWQIALHGNGKWSQSRRAEPFLTSWLSKATLILNTFPADTSPEQVHRQVTSSVLHAVKGERVRYTAKNVHKFRHAWRGLFSTCIYPLPLLLTRHAHFSSNFGTSRCFLLRSLTFSVFWAPVTLYFCCSQQRHDRTFFRVAPSPSPSHNVGTARTKTFFF